MISGSRTLTELDATPIRSSSHPDGFITQSLGLALNRPIKRLNSIEAARGFAALLVVLYHATVVLALPKYLGISALGGLFNFGHAGVDFFFVLSGFIIFYVHSGDIGLPARRLTYFWRRFSRIYPTYWVACIVILAAFAAGFGAIPSVGKIFSDLLLVPYGVEEPFVGVAWSLEHEVLFYVLFGILIWQPTIGVCLFGLWLLGIVAAAAGMIGGPYPVWFVFHPNNMEFFFGIAGTFVVARSALSRPGLVAIVGILAFLSFGLLEDVLDPLGGTYVITWRVAYGLSAAVVITGLAQYERASGAAVPASLVFLGAASYAIYLTHQMIMSLISREFLHAGLDKLVSGSVIWLVLVLLSLVLSVLFYLAVDRPLGQRLHGRVGKSSRHRPTALPTVN